ncbi:glycine cleavage system protein H, partial [Photobacterium sp. R1]
KAASDVYAPISGVVVAINEDLELSPELVNNDPYGDGWLIQIKADDEGELDELLDAEGYQEFTSEDE